MSESTLSLERTRWRREVGRMLGYGRDPSAWTGGLAYQATDVDDCIQSGLIRFYASHDWKFLKVPTIEIPLYAPYSTGTVAVVSGVVTLSGGTFPAWAANGEISVSDGEWYAVSTRDGNTQVTLRDTSVNVSAGATYELIQAAYTLPDEFAGFGDESLTYRPGGSTIVRSVRLVGEAEIRERRQANDMTFDQVLLAALRPRSTTGADGQRFELAFWPPPNASGRLLCPCRIHPNMLTASFTYPWGGMLHGEAILAASLAAAQVRFPALGGVDYEGLFQRLLADSIRRDSEMAAPKSLGYGYGAGPYRTDSDGDSDGDVDCWRPIPTLYF